MTEEELKRHKEWYQHYFGYSELTPQRACRRGALTTQSKW